MEKFISSLTKLLTPKEERVQLNMRSIYNGHFNITYRGIEALRCPFDYVIYQMIICKLRPDLVIEIGTNVGGGALYLADLMGNIGYGLVHTVDVTNYSKEIVRKHPRIRIFNEGWEAYDILNAAGFARVLIIEDSLHTYENTLNAMHKFAPLVTVGSYLIVEDGIVCELGRKKEFQGGPVRAIREFLRSNDHFAIDRFWCDFFGRNATFNVNGYLKKVK